MGELVAIVLVGILAYIVGYEQGEADGINKQSKYYPPKGDDDA